MHPLPARRFQKAARRIVLLVGLACAGARAATVTLRPFASGAFRWKDVAGNLYSAAYRDAYQYAQASVVITYGTEGGILRGRLSARNLKPNFAYQLKLIGLPEVDPAANKDLGFSGRWWKEDWDGVAWNGIEWVNGSNLNDKGSGRFPSPNDIAYLSMRDLSEPTSPTGRKHRFTGYRLFDYLVTDSEGRATLDFAVRRTYHVLWKTSQLAPFACDGPVKTHAFDPQPGFAYDVDHPAATVSIFGEWERLPAHDQPLPPGSYILEFLLTEESFHDSGLGGAWAHAGHGEARFTIPSVAARHASLVIVR